MKYLVTENRERLKNIEYFCFALSFSNSLYLFAGRIFFFTKLLETLFPVPPLPGFASSHHEHSCSAAPPSCAAFVLALAPLFCVIYPWPSAATSARRFFVGRVLVYMIYPRCKQLHRCRRLAAGGPTSNAFLMMRGFSGAGRVWEREQQRLLVHLWRLWGRCWSNMVD